MRNCIAVMNTKGGVGKSTLVLGLAETISAFHAKNVLVIDSDSQASVSTIHGVLVYAKGEHRRTLIRENFEAVADDGRELRREVVGWRASGAVCRDVAAFLADGTLP